MVSMNEMLRSMGAALLMGASILPAMDAAASEDDIRNCYGVHGEARYGALAYKHVVIVTNRCDVQLQCEVWTDVDPTPKVSLSVGPKATGEVITRATSPARSFKAYGECQAK